MIEEVREEESLEGYEIPLEVSLHRSSSVRTFFVFIDLPQHIEFRAGEMPLISKGTELELDMALRNPRNPKKVKRIQGVHNVVRSVLKYSSTRPPMMGLSQYLELAEGPTPK